MKNNPKVGGKTAENTTLNKSLNNSQKLSQQEEQDNSQIEGLSNSQQLPQQLSLKSIYQLFNMYVVEYDDGSGNTIKMHFNEEEYKRIFASRSGNYPYEYKESAVGFKSVLDDMVFQKFNDSMSPSSFENEYLKLGFENEYLKHGFADCYFKYETNKNNILSSSDKHEPKNPLFYYSTKETPSTKQQKQGGDIPEKIEVNFNIAYGEGKISSTVAEFNDNILSCYIKIQSGDHRGKYIKFTPEMDGESKITIKRDDKLYSCEDKDMKEMASVDYFTKLVEGDLPKLEFKINSQLIVRDNSQQVVGHIEPIFSSSPTFDKIKAGTAFEHEPSSLNVENPNLLGGGEKNSKKNSNGL